MSINALTQKIEKYIYYRPRDFIVLFNEFIDIAHSLSKEKIDNKVFYDTLDYYSVHVDESISAEFLSLPYELNYSQFLTSLKDTMKNEKSRIRVKKFIDILSEFKLSEQNIESFLLFILQIKFVQFMQNSNPIQWHKLSDPKVRLTQILKTSHKRYFYFPPIIQKVIEDRY